MFKQPGAGHFASLLLVAIILTLVWPAISEPPVQEATVQRLDGATMGTRWSVQLPELPEGITESRLQFDIDQILSRLDREIFSSWSENSEVATFNQLAVGESIAVSPELISVLNIAAMVHRASSGAFDITVASLVNLWGFGPNGDPGQIPAQAAIDEARALVGVDAIGLSRDPPGLRKVRQVQIDLSAIAKGYAVDMLGLYLDNLGLEHYLVEIGGEVRLRGDRGGRPWRLAIEAPQTDSREAFAIIAGTGEALSFAGSGDYRNFFETDGVRYSHTLDPRTGRPVEHALVSVTVASSVTALADGMATAFLVLGPEQGFSLASSLNLPAYFIIQDDTGYRARYTEAFIPYLSTQ